MIKIRTDCPECGKETLKAKGVILCLSGEGGHCFVTHGVVTGEDLAHFYHWIGTHKTDPDYETASST